MIGNFYLGSAQKFRSEIGYRDDGGSRDTVTNKLPSGEQWLLSIGIYSQMKVSNLEIPSFIRLSLIQKRHYLFSSF